MPNLLLTQKCVRKCPYCFADSYMSESSDGRLAWDDYIYLLDFYERNGIRLVSMLGGEPTTHPEVTRMMEYAFLRGFDVRVFTSGIMPADTREAIRDLWLGYEPERKLRFIVNVNHPSDTPDAHRASQAAFLEAAGERASISFNIYREDFDLSFVFDLIARYDLKPVLRMGLTHPIARAREGNAFVPPASYCTVADTLARFLPLFDRNRVVPDFDCGFPICMFTDDQIGALLRLRASFNWTCGPIVDIGPDLQVWPCFPLSHLRGKTLYDFDTFSEMRETLAAEVRERRKGNTGIYVECDECVMRERELCSGGCVAYAIPEAES